MDLSDAIEFFLERAAIIEIDGGRSRPDAHYAAIILTRMYCERNGIEYPDTPRFRINPRLKWSDKHGGPVDSWTL